MFADYVALGCVLVLSVVFAILYIAIGKRKREPIRSMRAGAKPDVVQAPLRERNRLGPATIYTETVVIEGVEHLQITFMGNRLLPESIVIVKPGTAFSIRARQPVLLLDPRLFGSLNRLAGKTVFSRVMEGLIARLWQLCPMCLVTAESIRVLLPTSQEALQDVPEINNLLQLLAAQLAASMRGFDLRVNDAYLTLRESEIPEDRLIALSILIEFYPKHRWTKELLPVLVKDRDFDLACLAAKGLGMDQERFAFSRIEEGDPETQVKAVRFLGKARRHTGLDFLLGNFPKAKAPEVRREIVLAFKEFADPRAEAALLQTFPSSDPGLLPAVLDALAVCGGQAALAPLYALERDRSRPRNLRDAAESAREAIIARLKLSRADAGRLSLAGDTGAEGGLSEAGKRPPVD